jgi:hypothetical protein
MIVRMILKIIVSLLDLFLISLLASSNVEGTETKHGVSLIIVLLVLNLLLIWK